MKAILITVGVVLIVVGAGFFWYLEMDNQVTTVPEEQNSGDEVVEPMDMEEMNIIGQKSTIEWEIEDAGETDGIPYTDVTVLINNTPYEVGNFQGSCSEIGASGGVDGTGLLVGQLSGVQCWYAGGGKEIGVFANEDKGFDIMVGVLDEGSAETEGFRGDFEVSQTIEL